MSSILEQIALPYVPCTYDSTLPYLEFVTREEYSSYMTEYEYVPIRYYDGHHNKTMIMCHGNGEDIGHADPLVLSNTFNVNVCVFDYAGYGLHSSTTRSTNACKDDVIAVYYHLIKVKKVNHEQIIIYGRSLGTWVACDLANYLCNVIMKPPLKLILISPLMSAVKIVTNLWSPIDILMNYYLAPKIHCPTLIVHGNQDQVVPYSCGLELSKLFPNLYRFVTLNGVGHNNIFTPTYYQCIIEFLLQ